MPHYYYYLKINSIHVYIYIYIDMNEGEKKDFSAVKPLSMLHSMVMTSCEFSDVLLFSSVHFFIVFFFFFFGTRSVVVVFDLSRIGCGVDD